MGRARLVDVVGTTAGARAGESSGGGGGGGGVAGVVAGAQGAGADRLLPRLAWLPARRCRGVVAFAVAVEGEVGKGVCQVGQRVAGQGGEAPGRARGEGEFGCRQGGVAVEGDVGGVEELGQRQLVLACGDDTAL